jgi:hypothetical protein
MPLTNAERQRLARTPSGQATGQQGDDDATGAATRASGSAGGGNWRLRHRPVPRAPSGRLREAYLALKQERDEMAMTLAQIEAYEPGIAAKARAWVEQIDRTPRRRGLPPSG